MKAHLALAMARFVALPLGCLALAVSISASVSAQEQRTWSDRTGKFKIEAKLLGVADGKVKLERRDGSVVQIDLTKLSAADQKFIKDQDEANPFQPAEDNPFKSVDESDGSSAPSGSGTPGGGQPKQVKVDWSDSEAIPLTPTADGWQFKTPIEQPKLELRNRAISIPPKSNFFEGLKGLVVNASRQRALVGYTLDEPKPEGTTRIALVDLAKGKTLIATKTSGKMIPLALSDLGAQVLMRKEQFGFGNNDRLELWSLSPGGINRVLSWTPYDEEKGGGRDVQWAAFIDENRFATLGGSGKLAIWNAKTATPIYHLQIDGGCVPALSPDRKLLAFSTGKQIGVLDLGKQEVVALQATAHTPWPKLAFSPDGSRLACSAHSKLFVWNFADGSLYREIPLTGTNVNANELVWPHEKYLLLGKTSLFDIDNQVRLWTYRGHDAVEYLGGNQAAFVVNEGQDRPGAVVIGPIPAPGFQKALEAAMKQPDFFVLKEGTTVKLNVDALPDASEREKVRETLAKKLQERGFQVGPQGTIELIASAEAGKEQDISYHGFGISPWKSYKVREFISKLTFVYQGQNTWLTQGSSVPGFISLKEGETIEQVLRRSERPNYTFFEHVELPKVLMKPMGNDGIGASQVSIAGVQ